MVATTDQKARAFDLFTSVMELARDGNRNLGDVCNVLQAVKDDPNFVQRLLGNSGVAMRHTWPVWRTLTIGGKTQQQLREELEKGGFSVSVWAADIMQKSSFLPLAETTEVRLIRIKVRDLGFTHEPTTTELFARAKERGLDLCPAEVGPHLRLADNDQEHGTCYWVAMEPISDSDGSPYVFYVVRYDVGERWLDADCGTQYDRWNLSDTFVVRLCK